MCGCGCSGGGSSSPGPQDSTWLFGGSAAGPIIAADDLVSPTVTALGPRVDVGVEASWSAIFLLVLLIAGGVVVYRWAQEG